MRTQNFTNCKFLLLIALLLCSWSLSAASRQMEYLDRGVVAVKVNNGVFLSWRYLGTDDPSVGFNIYRDGTKVNDAPVTTKTNYLDTKGGANSKYVIKSVIGGKELETSKAVTPWASQRKTIKLNRPGTNYNANDMSVGDVDGDGQYELFLKWDPSNAKDNSQSGATDKVYIDCYTFEGNFLWRIDLGVNIRAGAHYTQYQVFDYDGDGKCELVCKTAPGTKDGKGKNVIMGNDNPNANYRNGSGYILSGPEYLTIFEGATGAEIHTVAYKPARGNVNGWGDGYGNRVDRFLACTAYLDGEHPSVVMCRGYYTRSTLAAYDFKNGKLVERWFHDSPTRGQGAFGEGYHNVSVADVDGDGKDEIIYGSACIDDNGKLIYRTGYGHGDAMHVSDMIPGNGVLEGWFVHEEKGSAYGYELRNLKTGKVIFGQKTNTDNGRGMAADIDANHKGFEMWSSYGSNVFNCNGKSISNKKPSVNFRVYWDGDLQDELLDGNKCDKWNGNGTTRLMTFTGSACNGSKNTPNLSGDIIGDWREEVILHDGANLYIYTTTIESKYRMYTLMHDAVYRCAIAWQNTAYNQPPHLGIYIGDGLNDIKQPDIYTAGKEAAPAVATLTFEGKLAQDLLPGESIMPITFTFGGTATGVDVPELPEGLTAKVEGNSVVISGKPSAAASFTVKTKGGDNVVEHTVNISLAPEGLKNVAYVTDASNENYKNDKILAHLKAEKGWYVREFDALSSNFDYSLFDLIIISETAPSTAPIMAELEGIDKPVLSMKVHAYKEAAGAWGWAAEGFGDNTTETNLVVAEKYLSHPMFKDVKFVNGNEVQMVTEVNVKALTYMNPESLTDKEGTIESVASIKGEEAVSIFEIEAGAKVAGTVIPENYIQIGLNSSSYANVTDDALSVIKNACLYLLGDLKKPEETTGEGLVLVENGELEIYPNPVKEAMFIVNGSEDAFEASLQIVSLDGAVAAEETVLLNSGANVLNRANLNVEAGLYVVSLRNSQGELILVKTVLFK
ncbi:MAG: T9SS type A sorting domain-containing protein [Paludibacteraceae bacterium]|nr:T9SS type A sorting domain-containing protein [Paludibacteraceae bacterium]